MVLSSTGMSPVAITSRVMSYCEASEERNSLQAVMTSMQVSFSSMMWQR